MKKVVAKVITREDLKFWAFLIGIIVGGVVWATRLEGRVNAMTSREQANKTVFVDFVKETTIKLDKIIGNQIIIATELGIEIER